MRVEWTATLRGQNQPGGVVPTYAGVDSENILAAAEALAHFVIRRERPIFTLEEHIEVTYPGVHRADQLVPVSSILHYVRKNRDVLSGLSAEEVERLERLADELGV